MRTLLQEAWFPGGLGTGTCGADPPSDTTLLFAERNAWRKIHKMVQGTTLSDALKNIRGDFLFWQREVYEHLNRAPEKGKNKGKAPKVWQTQWEKPKKGGPSKGKSPNSPSVPWPDHWAFKNPKGVAYCRDHQLHNKCSGSRGRSHNCPVRKDGWVCDAPPLKHAPGMPSPSQVTGGHSGCHRPRGFPVSVGTTGHQCESAHSGRQTERVRWEGTSPGCHRPEAPPPRKRSGPRALQAPTEAVGRPPRERPRGEDPLRLRWTPRPVPGSSKPSLILLHAGKDDAGALDAYLRR